MGRVLFKTDAVFDVRLDAGVRHDDAVVQNDVLAAGVRPDVTGLDVSFDLVVVFLEELETRRDFIHVHIAEFHSDVRFAGVIYLEKQYIAKFGKQGNVNV